MASQLPGQPDRVELDDLRNRLKSAIQWRDVLANHLAKVEAEIAADARAFATLNGDFVRPTIDQLRRTLFEKERSGP